MPVNGAQRLTSQLPLFASLLFAIVSWTESVDSFFNSVVSVVVDTVSWHVAVISTRRHGAKRWLPVTGTVLFLPLHTL